MAQYNQSLSLCIYFPTGTPSSPVLTCYSTFNEILVSWSPVDSNTVCGPVTYNITVLPSHGMIMMINDTVYNITGLNYNTNYVITVYATNHNFSGESTRINVETKPGIHMYIILFSCVAVYDSCMRIYTVINLDLFIRDIFSYHGKNAKFLHSSIQTIFQRNEV